jgi:ABC-type Zn uptake system ZnuABC Zn-binding protein ZnuA
VTNPLAVSRRTVLAGATGALLVPLATSRAAGTPPTVLTGTQATYSLAVALAAGTPLVVQNVPADGRQLALLKDYIQRRTDSLAATFAAASAVISVTNALPNDPLYRFARDANIRIVNIDAALPWSLDTPGVALADTPTSANAWGGTGDAAETATAPYFWLSISNAIRMADIIAHDLGALFPESAAIIVRNLDDLKRSLLELRGDYQKKLIEGTTDVVFALTGDFVYLTNDMGLFVDGYFIKQDVRWTPADLKALTQHLRDNGIKVVIHKWQPSESIQNAIDAGGAKLVVLESGDPGIVIERQLAPDGLQQILSSNLEAIHAALGAP